MRTPRRTSLAVALATCAASMLCATSAAAQEGGRAVFTGNAPWLAFLIAVGGLILAIGAIAMAGRGVGPPATLTPEEEDGSEDEDTPPDGVEAPPSQDETSETADAEDTS